MIWTPTRNRLLAVRWAAFGLRGARTATAGAALAAMAVLSACASPPLRLYTLAGPPAAISASPGTISRTIVIDRVALPDYVDSQDIVTRSGADIKRSANGRWAARLSNGITDLITAQLAARDPSALVTDQPSADTPAFRVQINISQLDITADGSAVMAANWAIVPQDSRMPIRRDRGSFTTSGAAGSDAAVVALTRALVLQLVNRVGPGLQ